MNPIIQKILEIFNKNSSKKKVLTTAGVFIVLLALFLVFVMVNKSEYSVLYSDLNSDDASAITEVLKKSKVRYKLKEKGTAILVPQESVYELRLEVAASGLPKGGNVGYEIFDKTDFTTTEFVQKINHLRALQGELARTIKEFNEVKNAKVMVVLPKDSVFIEEVRPPSASILLELKSDLDESKVSSIVHLVASSIEGLESKNITIVDTKGNILFKEKTQDELDKAAKESLAETQLEYRKDYEKELAKRIESMLERIVGIGKAIVRVTADMDFRQINTEEEIYDPDERNQNFVRSRKSLSENAETISGPLGSISSVNPIVPPGQLGLGEESKGQTNKQSDIVNYELSKVTRKIIKPIAVVRKISVAAVIDGKYNYETTEKEAGKKIKKYIERNPKEMEQFKNIVANAMGYDEERGDQVSVECFPFSSMQDEMVIEEFSPTKYILKNYSKYIINMLLIILLFIFVIRPIIKTIRDIQSTVEEEPPLAVEEEIKIEQAKEKMRQQKQIREKKLKQVNPVDIVSPKDFVDMNLKEKIDFLQYLNEEQKVKYLLKLDIKEMINILNTLSEDEKEKLIQKFPVKERAVYYANTNFDKTVNIIRAWAAGEYDNEDNEDKEESNWMLNGQY